MGERCRSRHDCWCVQELQAENEHSRRLLRECLVENEALKERVRQLESEKHESERYEVSLCECKDTFCSCCLADGPMLLCREGRASSKFSRVVADALCEELVLLDEDIAFISKIVRPAEVDPYISNAGAWCVVLNCIDPSTSRRTVYSNNHKSVFFVVVLAGRKKGRNNESHGIESGSSAATDHSSLQPKSVSEQLLERSVQREGLHSLSTAQAATALYQLDEEDE